MWLTPWGWTPDYPPAYTIQNNLARDAVAALTAVYGTPYVYGPIYETIYPVSGGSNDYTYGHLGIVHSYAVELHSGGFVLPPSVIAPSGIETFEALKVWALTCAKV